MQRHQILINRFFSSVTQTTEVQPINVELTGDYYMNTQNVPNKVVNKTNVRGFIQDPNNSMLVNGFFIFLTGTSILNSSFVSNTFTPTEQFIEIYYDDEKLSSLLNDYYENSYLLGEETPLSSITNQLSAQTGVFVYNTRISKLHNFKWEYNNNMSFKYLDYIPLDMTNNIRLTTSKKKLIKTPIEQSYYIPVFVSRHFELLNSDTPGIFCDLPGSYSESYYYNNYSNPIPLPTSAITIGISASTIGIGQSYLYPYSTQKIIQNNDNSNKSTTKYYSIDYINKICEIFINAGFLIGGSYGLSKQGTIYREGFHDIDVTILDYLPKVKLNETHSIEKISGIESNLVAPSISKVIYDLNNAGEKIKSIQKLNIDASVRPCENVFRITMENNFNVDIFHYESGIVVSDFSKPGLLDYRLTLQHKLLMGRQKDLDDIRLFKKFGINKSLQKNSVINSTNQLIQCFVDLNLNPDENSFWTEQIPTIKFVNSIYEVKEGESAIIEVEITSPALGNESVQIYAIPGTATEEDYVFPSPLTVNFNQGETVKQIIFPIIDMDDLELTETFILKLKNPFNASILFDECIIKIIEKINARTVQFDKGSAQEEFVTSPLHSNYIYTTKEMVAGQAAQFSITCSLDAPAIGGESLMIYQSLSGITLNSYPKINGDYFYVGGDAAQIVSGMQNGVFTHYWNIGDNVKTINLKINPDAVPENTEEIQFLMAPSNNLIIGEHNEYIVKIVENDSQQKIQVNIKDVHYSLESSGNPVTTAQNNGYCSPLYYTVSETTPIGIKTFDFLDTSTYSCLMYIKNNGSIDSRIEFSDGSYTTMVPGEEKEIQLNPNKLSFYLLTNDEYDNVNDKFVRMKYQIRFKVKILMAIPTIFNFNENELDATLLTIDENVGVNNASSQYFINTILYAGVPSSCSATYWDATNNIVIPGAGLIYHCAGSSNVSKTVGYCFGSSDLSTSQAWCGRGIGYIYGTQC